MAAMTRVQKDKRAARRFMGKIGRAPMLGS
jgi:hypothetical protein